MTVTAGSFTANRCWQVVSTYIAAWAGLHIRAPHLPTALDIAQSGKYHFAHFAQFESGCICEPKKWNLALEVNFCSLLKFVKINVVFVGDCFCYI
jgi:hypothetical protein